MIRTRPMMAIACASFRPASPLTLIGVATYGAYLTWLAMREINTVGDAVYIHLCFALATAAAWIGACVGRTGGWYGALFTPALMPALGVVAAVVTISVVCLNWVVAWAAGLDPWVLAPFGTFATVAGLAGGFWRPALVKYLYLCMWILLAFAPVLFRGVALPLNGMFSLASVTVLAAATALFVHFVVVVRRPSTASPTTSAPTPVWRLALAELLPNRLSEPSTRRIAIGSGVLAVCCTFAHRFPGFDWRDGPLIILIGGLCANLGASGISASMPRGPVPGVSWLLLSGIAKTRSHAARRVLWRIVTDSFLAAGVFTAVTVALGPDWRLVEMMLVALAACHAYLAAVCPSRWLLSSRLSVFVATPVVVAVAVAAWDLAHWNLPTAFAACVLSGVAAVYVGGIGMGRIDLDPAPNTEPAL
ncbi:MAG: hypothetical protein F4029_19335 [Gammaproteobacteria bacterium]|nr:hypothetical protein [Gammaproteobacteria bacterium]MYF30738.1 hypothetical protein [Gammaproteobacteria bacterium]MYK48367.1 hypothetical protein [Gammaproteobacteria bacterium]